MSDTRPPVADTGRPQSVDWRHVVSDFAWSAVALAGAFLIMAGTLLMIVGPAAIDAYDASGLILIGTGATVAAAIYLLRSTGR